ncbi:MAG: glycosyltransferase [Gemmatimonadota bacterium]
MLTEWLLPLPWALPWFGWRRLARKEPDLARHAPVAGVPVSVIIPARNEAVNIERVVTSVLASAYRPFELIVVDDRSTDDTAARVEAIAARDSRVRLVHGAEVPAGWFGKPWACWQGARAATGDLLVFTDADTVHQPALLGHAVAAFRSEQPGLLSLAPRQRCESFWERIVQPQFLWLLGCRYHPQRVNRATRRRDVLANGQFILLARATYDAIGGHEAVRDQVAEDLALAQRIMGAGQRVYFAFAETLIATRMYRNLGELIEGWSKNVYLGGRQSFPDEPVLRALAPLLEILAVLFWIVPPALVAAALVGLGGWWLMPAIVATVMSVAFWAVINAAMGVPRRWALLYPLGAGMALYIVVRSMVRGRRKVEWRGRIHALPPSRPRSATGYPSPDA